MGSLGWYYLRRVSLTGSNPGMNGRLGRLMQIIAATPTGKSDGGWDSIHVFESIDRARTSHYKLTSTVILRLSTSSDALGDMDLSGNMTRQIEQDMPVTDDSSHIVNVGKLVEDMELKMRNLLRMRMHLFALWALLTFVDRGGLFRKSKRCCRRPPKYVTLLFSSVFHLPRCRHSAFDRGEQGEGDTSRDDQFHEAVIDTSLGAQNSQETCSVDSKARHPLHTILAVHV